MSAGLETCILFLRAEACFLGRFVEEDGHRASICASISCAVADRSVVAEAVEDLAAQGPLRVLGEASDAEGCCKAVRKMSIPVKEEGRRVRPLASLPLLATWWSSKEIRPLVWPVPSGCPVCEHHMNWTRSSGCVCIVMDGALELNPSGSSVWVGCGVVGVP